MTSADLSASTAPDAYRRRPGLNAVAMDGELVMMGMEQGEYYGLRDVAASIWQHLAEPRTTEELCTLVAEEYAVTADGCRDDVVAFLDDNENLQAMTVAGLRVLSPDRIEQIVHEKEIDRVLLAMPSASAPKQMQIARRLQSLGLDVLALPSFAQLVGTEALIDNLAPVTADTCDGPR